ncbi:hypothetical protein HNY73_012017 [Argiope bruennichi]|uniref:Uncharacterized protein n=1 Tax=Argiope bruennichi TaxID=94029 RepID=A0A8T0EU75_ARGBR|nr:hypothetical protein HNY73_012017 [Argiope bruennichi]
MIGNFPALSGGRKKKAGGAKGIGFSKNGHPAKKWRGWMSSPLFRPLTPLCDFVPALRRKQGGGGTEVGSSSLFLKHTRCYRCSQVDVTMFIVVQEGTKSGGFAP